MLHIPSPCSIVTAFVLSWAASIIWTSHVYPKTAELNVPSSTETATTTALAHIGGQFFGFGLLAVIIAVAVIVTFVSFVIYPSAFYDKLEMLSKALINKDTQQLHSSLQARVDTLTAENDALHAELTACKEVLPSPPAQNASTPPVKLERYHFYFDWMKLMAIYMVVVYHVVQALEWVGFWCGSQRDQVTSFRCVALQIGMPLFFHISGRARAMSKPAALVTDVSRRAARLLIPYVVCYIVLIPPWRWIHEHEHMWACVTDETKLIWQNQTLIPSGKYWTIVAPYPEMPQDLINYSIEYWNGTLFEYDSAWLWFLPTLFIVTISSTPVMLFAEFHHLIHFVIGLAIWLFLAAVLWGIPGYSWSFVVFLALAPVGTLAVSLKVPFPLQLGSQDFKLERFLAVRVTTALYVLSTVGLVLSFSYNDMAGSKRWTPQMLIYPMFYMQGFFVQRWCPEGASFKLIESQTEGQGWKVPPSFQLALNVYQLLLVMCVLIVILVGSPVGSWEVGNWPIYSASFHNNEDLHAAGYVLSTWAWIGIIDALFQAYADMEFDRVLHKHASASTMIVYLFHWIFIKIFVWHVVRDLGLMCGLWRWIAPPLTFFFGAGCSIGVYALLIRYPIIGRLFGL